MARSKSSNDIEDLAPRIRFASAPTAVLNGASGSVTADAIELDHASQLDRAGQDELDMAAGANSCAWFEFLRVNQTTPSPAGIPAKRTQADITETF